MVWATDLILNGNIYKIGTPTMQVDFLLVGGGGAGGQAAPYQAGGGGGAGGVVLCCCQSVLMKNYQITIGKGQCYCIGTQGGSSCFGSYVARGGGRGAGQAESGCPGASGGGGSQYCPGGVGSQGCDGGYGCDYTYAGGGGGFTSSGLKPEYCKQSTLWTGGIGIQSDISGNMEYYAYGGGGGGCYCTGYGGTSPGGGGYGGGCCADNPPKPPTSCGSGGGGTGYYGANNTPSDGADGIFVLRYPTACGYNISGGTKYTCGNYTIHCFTSDGTLTVS